MLRDFADEIYDVTMLAQDRVVLSALFWPADGSVSGASHKLNTWLLFFVMPPPSVGQGQRWHIRCVLGHLKEKSAPYQIPFWQNLPYLQTPDSEMGSLWRGLRTDLDERCAKFKNFFDRQSRLCCVELLSVASQGLPCPCTLSLYRCEKSY